MKTKQCITCGEVKPVSAFYKQVGRKAANQCKECRKAWQKDYNRKRAESMAVNAEAILSSDEAVEQYLKEHPIDRNMWRLNAMGGYHHADFNNRTGGF